MTCSECNHEHTGLDLAGICIGCACPHVVVLDADEQPICDVCSEPWPCAVVKGET